MQGQEKERIENRLEEPLYDRPSSLDHYGHPFCHEMAVVRIVLVFVVGRKGT
jgi:hypothetical protein